jgi:hypothetical protein
MRWRSLEAIKLERVQTMIVAEQIKFPYGRVLTMQSEAVKLSCRIDNDTLKKACNYRQVGVFYDNK